MSDGFNVREFLDIDNMSEEEIDRCEFWCSANRIYRETGVPNFKAARIPVNNTWDLDLMEQWLKNYKDVNLIQYLRFGWPLNTVETAQDNTIPANQQGARENPEEIRRYLKNELEKGAIIGPFKRNPFGKNARFSPLDTRPKKDSEEKRIILNLSFPFEGPSVNASINKSTYADQETMEVRYPSVDDLAAIIRLKKRKGNVKIMKRDLSRAYHQLYMSPESILYLGYTFEGFMYFHVMLSMGSASAAYCCQRTTDAITFIYKEVCGYDNVNYLDDLGAAEIEELADHAFQCLGEILTRIGIQESESKACAPCFIMMFLGILFNTKDMTMTITKEWLEEIKTLLRVWIHKKTASLKEMQMILGKLSFAASTVRAGRVFISRIINDIKNFNSNGWHAITNETKKDFLWWLRFMEKFDGVTILPPLGWESPDWCFSTDSCLVRCGGWAQFNQNGGEAFTLQFPEWIMKRPDIHINEKELLVFTIALKVWKEKNKEQEYSRLL